MTIVVSGSDEPHTVTLKKLGDKAMEALDWKEQITLEVLSALPGELPTTHASASGRTIRFKSSWASDHADDRDTLALTIFEEIGHAYLRELGVPHGPAPEAVYIQEVFANWFAYSLAREVGRDPTKQQLVATRDIQTLPNPAANHVVAVHVGAGLAGSKPHREAAEAWIRSRGSNPPKELHNLLLLSTALLENDDLLDPNYAGVATYFAEQWRGVEERMQSGT